MSIKPLPGHFRLLYFAYAASFTRKSSDDFSAPLPLQDLFGLLEEKYPGMTKAVLSSAAVTLNLNYVDIEQYQEAVAADAGKDYKGIMIEEGDEVAIIPPVSSG
ncbi:hypothetical protein MMC28_006125 [Mycoblastus sanguinarius]|nr:hypothetical protein [Mycoblastus sanguinarius]